MKNQLILVVEDDDDIRESLLEILGDAGYQTAAAENGQVALDLLSAGAQPQLILLDLMMPVMPGDEFLQHQQATATLASIPVLVLSASTSAHSRSLAGVTGWIGKPFHYDQLMRAIESALHTH